MGEEILDEYDAVIENEVRLYFSRAKEEASYHPFLGRLYENLAEYVLRRGRRLATTSALLVYSGIRGGVDANARTLALALELYRHAILLHDDLVDGDEERRGGKAFHRLFGLGEGFGEAAAVFTGNMLYAMAFEVLEDVPKSEELRRLFARAYREVNESQVLDAYFEHVEPSVEEWYAMASRRAPSLFRLTLLAGAVLAEAGREDREHLERAGTEIGYAFDIQDDIIGTFATREQYGREPGGDVLRGKKPLHIALALELAPEKEREELRRILASRSAGRAEIERVKEIVRSCGALDEAKRIAGQHAAGAKTEIGKTSLSEEVKQVFAGFIDYVAESLEWYA
ncbi:polyprenyl synthetase family protein [Candidatus Pyrohabitans sp.]